MSPIVSLSVIGFWKSLISNKGVCKTRTTSRDDISTFCALARSAGPVHAQLHNAAIANCLIMAKSPLGCGMNALRVPASREPHEPDCEVIRLGQKINHKQCRDRKKAAC